MPRHAAIDRYTLEAALVGLDLQKSALDAKAREIRRMLHAASADAPTEGSKPRQKKRKMSAAGRRRIRAALKKRWAEYHSKKGK